MPELPEVETIRRELTPLVQGRRVVAGGSHPSDRFTAARDVAGATIEAVQRRGKYLLFDLSGPVPAHRGPDRHHADRQRPDRQLIVHLGMTGMLRPGTGPATPGGGELDPYVRAWWTFEDGCGVELRDVRRFGRVAVVPTGDHSSQPTLHRLGPEPLSDDFSPDGLWRALRSSSLRVKTHLLNQRAVAGVGNIYADEALWAAGVNPGARVLSRRKADSLYGSIRTVLAAGIVNGGTTLRDYRTVTGASGRNQHHLSCYGRAGLPCTRCGVVLERRVLDGRGTTWCRRCQRH